MSKSHTGIAKTFNCEENIMTVSPPSQTFALIAVCILLADAVDGAYFLNTTCSPPPSQGGTGYCGPSFCSTVRNTLPACVFTNKVYNYASEISKLSSKNCVQSPDPRCTSAALKALMKGQGIKAAYCNDAFLVIHTDGTTGYSNYLSSVTNPPGAVDSTGTTCVTRYTNPGFATVKIPLYPTLLATSDPLINNVNTRSFPNGGADASAAYMSVTVPNTAATYGLPTRGRHIHLETQKCISCIGY